MLFRSAISMRKVSHAYIINGPQLSGKMMIAEAFASALQCEKAVSYTHLKEVVKESSDGSSSIKRDVGEEMTMEQTPVSYTHLDVYKRQVRHRAIQIPLIPQLHRL